MPIQKKMNRGQKKSPLRKLLSLLSVVFLLLFLPGVIYAGGQGEDSEKSRDYMEDARQLVQEKKYDEAILLLTEYIRIYPERLSEAQQLIRQIQKIRSAYNSRYEELLYVLYVEEDVEKSLELIEELTTLDTDPNPRTQEAIREARAGARLVYSRKRFREIMDNALVLLGEERYGEAVELYFSGFDLQKEEFDAMDYGNVLKGRVDDAYENMTEAADSFLSEADQYRQAWETARLLLESGTAQELAAELPDALETFHLMARRRKTIYNASAEFDRVNEEVQRIRSDNKEDLFLSYATRLASGRRETDATEGLSGTVDLLYEKYLADLSAIASARSRRLQEEAWAAYDGGQWERAETLFSQSGAYQSWAREAVGLWRDQIYLTRSGAVYEEGEAFLQEYYPPWEEIRQRQLEAARAPALITRRALLEGRTPSAGTALSDYRDLRRQLEEDQAFFDGQREYWNARLEGLNQQIQAGLPSGEAPQEATILVSRLNTALALAREKEGQTAERLVQGEWQPLAERWEGVPSRYEESQQLAAGVEREFVQGETVQTILSRYPGQASDQLENLGEDLTQWRQEAQAFLDRWEGEKDYIRQRELVANQIAQVREILSRAAALSGEAAAFKEDVDQRVFEAQTLRNEGEFRFTQAQRALENENFDQARTNLATARDRFTASLEIQEDLEFRNSLDTRMDNLAAAIVEEENRAVVRDVRQYITQGKNYYIQGRYEEAEEILLRAKDRWLVTNAEENEEVNYWYNLVDNALKANTGRVIAETDPLYTEMSQLLSLAYRDYEKGRELLADGNRRDALEKFERADQKLLQVRIPFPQNKRASVLSLRIEQIRDPGQARENLTAKFRLAQAKIDTNPQEAYTELTDIQELDPRLPGLADAIYRTEIRLGLRIPPPDPAALAQSREFTARAAQIVEAGDTTQYPIALEQLDRAIDLNPNNDQAIALKDRIQIETGGTATLSLSTQDNSRLLEAQELFIQGSYYEALGIVEELLQTPRNQNYTPLQKLRRRIESKI